MRRCVLAQAVMRIFMLFPAPKQTFVCLHPTTFSAIRCSLEVVIPSSASSGALIPNHFSHMITQWVRFSISCLIIGLFLGSGQERDELTRAVIMFDALHGSPARCPHHPADKTPLLPSTIARVVQGRQRRKAKLPECKTTLTTPKTLAYDKDELIRITTPKWRETWDNADPHQVAAFKA